VDDGAAFAGDVRDPGFRGRGFVLRISTLFDESFWIHHRAGLRNLVRGGGAADAGRRPVVRPAQLRPGVRSPGAAARGGFRHLARARLVRRQDDPTGSDLSAPRLLSARCGPVISSLAVRARMKASKQFPTTTWTLVLSAGRQDDSHSTE